MRRLSKKWANYRRRWHYLWLSETTPTGPLYINVEPTNACNLQCYTCSIDGTRKRGTMDMDLFRKIIDQSATAGVYEVALFMGGEPLLHKDLPEMIRYVEEKGLDSRVYTNATLLTREKAVDILDSGLSFLGVSIDGDNKEEYESMRIGADFDVVIDNVLGLLELMKERGADKPYVSLQMMKLLENPNQGIDPAFKALFNGLPIEEFSVRNPHDWRGEKGIIKLKDRGSKYYPCQVFWSAMSIAWDGRVVGCSADLNGKFILGDLNHQSIMEVWNGEDYRRHRRLMKQKKYTELGLCADCHAFWHDRHPRLSLLMQIPPFEQALYAAKWLLPGKRRHELENKSKGAIRARKQ